jgi:hypothetical protein
VAVLPAQCLTCGLPFLLLQVKPADDKLRFMVDNVLRKKESMTADNLADVAAALATMQVGAGSCTHRSASMGM